MERGRKGGSEGARERGSERTDWQADGLAGRSRRTAG
jgi:hypothetical protein